MKKHVEKKQQHIPELKRGTGFGQNNELKEYVNQLLTEKKITESGGIMKPGVYMKVFEDQNMKRIDHMSI